MSSSFCVLAWMHMASNSSGNLRLCCNSTPSKNMILDENGKPYRIDQNVDLLKTVYNSPWMKQIRSSMLNDEKISICQRCYTEEDAGVRSARQSWNEKYAASIEQMKSETLADGEYAFQPRYVDLRLGNLCNLKCRMCNPYASKKWLEDWEKIDNHPILPESEKKRLSAMDWFKSDQFVENLSSIIESIEEIYFTGGEPLLINKHFDLLQILITEKRASKVVLKYNTNVTYVPEKIFVLWSHFKKVVVNSSIDGVGDVNEYIRHPSKWNEIEKNLSLLDDFIASHKNMTGSIHTTVQMYNLEHLVPLFEKVRSFKGFQRFPYLNILNHPDYLNIRNAPQSFKLEITHELLEWKKSYQEDMSSEPQFQKIQGVVDYMNSSEMNGQDDFLKYTRQADEIRKELFVDVCPRLASSLGLSIAKERSL